ncbi:MAG: 2-succinyl-6-hydroxy-2,4-cyclohexadiene-carboxylic acid synthase/2-oxoglutarate decarboxylase [Frankiales bacterium]|nr:2-succinyl-6-hydroxy-2,4-cyclohexadiene-carboxylic acid synthase/2-oxoglutarate decarboxylase [Frankiales bacterium]
MNPSTALARTLVDELLRQGVTEAVLAPGSRSAPLAFALHDADIRLHVRIDERSAGFLALGLAKASGRPVPVVTTSGTAAVNLHPAVVEASYAHVPLLVLTADRPPELRGSGANQTIDQVKLYGDSARWFVEVGAPELGQEDYWRSVAVRAIACAAGGLGTPPGPVHLNLAFREPLVPDGAAVPAGRAATIRRATGTVRVEDDLPDRTLVVLGDGADLSVLELAASRGWPVIAETSSGATGPNVVDCGELLAGWQVPERVLVVGRPTLSRAIGRLVASAPSDVVASHGTWADPRHTADRVLPGVPAVSRSSTGWVAEWVEAGRRVRTAITPLLQELSEPSVAVAVASSPSPLVVGSSKPVRDLLLAPARTRVLANRGAAGIDGMISTAVGAALAWGEHTVALVGDLTFLHDSNSLVIGPDEPRPDLTIVVTNNDGGAIFGLLEQGAPEHESAFERVFGTPHGVDLEALCAATRTTYTRATTLDELRKAIRPSAGISVVEVRTDRTAAVTLDVRIREAAAAALRG